MIIIKHEYKIPTNNSLEANNIVREYKVFNDNDLIAIQQYLNNCLGEITIIK